MLIYVFCKSCKPEIVLPVLQIKTKTFSHYWFVQNTLINKELVVKFGLIEETMDLSCRKIQMQLHKDFVPIVSAHDFQIVIRARAMQKLAINYCFSLFFSHSNIFDILLCIKQMLSWLENMHKYVKFNSIEGGEEKTQIWKSVSDDAERNFWRASAK